MKAKKKTYIYVWREKLFICYLLEKEMHEHEMSQTYTAPVKNS